MFEFDLTYIGSMKKIKCIFCDNIDDLNIDQIRYQTGLTKYAFYIKFQEYFGKKPKELIAEIKEQILSENQRIIK
jgi:hypothetical protein